MDKRRTHDPAAIPVHQEARPPTSAAISISISP